MSRTSADIQREIDQANKSAAQIQQLISGLDKTSPTYVASATALDKSRLSQTAQAESLRRELAQRKAFESTPPPPMPTAQQADALARLQSADTLIKTYDQAAENGTMTRDNANSAIATVNTARDAAISDLEVAGLEQENLRNPPQIYDGTEKSDDLRAFREADEESLRAGDSVTVAPAAESYRRVIPSNDWRARLSLAPSANYLYRAQMPGILAPLLETDGVLFPYTPDVNVVYHAIYATKQMTHSNWEGKFYSGSNVGEIAVTASFTAQDEKEARYMLAVIHFFKSATKMFYGQDFERGSPPPVLFFSAFGEYQFNYAPVLMHQFTLHLPKDVDYIQTSASETPTMATAEKQPLRYTNAFTSTLARLSSAGLSKGGTKAPVEERSFERAPASSEFDEEWLADAVATRDGRAQAQTQAPAPVVERSFDSESTVNGITFVPTKIDITLTLHPLQSREQMSKEFSLKEFANGTLIKKGFW